MILNKENMKKLLFLIGFSMLLFWGVNHTAVVLEFLKGLLGVLSPFLVGLCFAFVINVLMRPIEGLWDRLAGEKRGSRAKRPVCLLLSTLMIAGAIFILLFMVVPEIRRTGATIIDMFPQYLLRLEGWWGELTDFFEEFAIVLPQPELNLAELKKIVGDFLAGSGQIFVGKTLAITTSIFSGVFNLFFGLVFAFYVLAQKETLSRQLKKLLRAYLPARRVEQVLDFAALTKKIFTNFVTGQLTEALIIGALCFLGMSLFRMPYAPMISVLVGFTALIPVFGAFFGTAIGAFLILMVDPVKAFWFIIFIIVLQQLEGDFIYPKVVGKSVGLPGIWVLAAVTVGGSAFGMLGMLLSVPVCSVLYCTLSRSVNRRLKSREPEPPVE